ncbi:hypothetical protein SIN8267_02404 [Sinobacterium norvegicum]|uniref:SGNH/GDSL hydrolase family protein n=1 Tax=Sinobacterium norvegicum TaxID=1641715 RepID=A0ABM9AHQ0_9GAMM|nr:hypothetical protein [Sinobacterium norvegicum]CAH0992285.1 hypothetical protein SIN8267_02404 [Sinobacterium norvegicum]
MMDIIIKPLKNAAFLCGLTTASKTSLIFAILTCCLSWGWLINLYSISNIKAGGRHIQSAHYDIIGQSSRRLALLSDLPGDKPLIIYGASSSAASAITSPSEISNILHNQGLDYEVVGFFSAGQTIWEIESAARHISPKREKILLLPVNMVQLQKGASALTKSALTKRILYTNTSIWHDILDAESVKHAPSLYFTAFDNLAYIAKRKRSLIRQYYTPPIKLNGWYHTKISDAEWSELAKTWGDPDYIAVPPKKRYLGPVEVRNLAAYTGLTRIKKLHNNVDEAEEILVRSIKRMQATGIEVITIDTPIDAESMARNMSQQEVDEILSEIRVRQLSIANRTDSKFIQVAPTADLDTSNFLDWVHIAKDSGKQRYTEALSKALGDLLHERQ